MKSECIPRKLKSCEAHPPKVPLPRRIAAWTGRMLAPVTITGLLCCGNGQEPQERITEPLDVSKAFQKNNSFPEETWDLCFDRLNEAYFGPPFDSGRGLSSDKMLVEMIEGSIALYKIRPKGSDRETPEGYIEHFTKAKYSNGSLMYPNVAEVLETSRNFADRNEKLLAGRRVAISLRPKRFPATYRLLHTMPHTAVTLVGMVNRPGGRMDIGHAEDIASLFDTLLGFQNRMDASMKLCDFRPNMSHEQLKSLDVYYSELIWDWRGNCNEEERRAWERRDVPGMHRMEWVCRHLKHNVENGSFKRLGLTRLPEGFERSYCVKRELEKQDETENYGRYGRFGVDGRAAREENAE
ncbi:MAG: hypothetical protein ABII71_04570 [Candidatus Micrarchaeota archaeon]